MSDSFVHLHAHSEYSMLDGAAKVKDMVRKAVALGQPAVATTDHGNVFSHYEMWKAAADARKGGADIKSILGSELYVAPASRFDKKKILWGSAGSKNRKGGDDAKDVGGGGAFTHMTMLAQNAAGLHALFELTSRASIEGQFPVGKPRIDAELVADVLGNWPGAVLIGTTGCPGGAVQTRIRLEQYERAVEEAALWQDLLGKENYFLELMDHGLAVEQRVRDDLLLLAKQLDIPLLATNDSHYVEESDAGFHDALLCVQMGAKVHEVDRLKFDGKYHLRSSEEMRALFDELPEACDNTLAIAERVAPDAYDPVLSYQDDLLPQYPVPEGHTPDTFLREQVMIGLQEKYPDPDGPDGITQEAWDRVPGYEVPVIERMGYSSYMLMVWDFVGWAREQGIRVGPGRGSAAGSGTSYALDITTVPTLENGLLFERFINPERVSPPDVDVDFMKNRRDEVFRYLAERWGAGNVCRIQTINTIKAKAAIKDAARVLDVPFQVGAKMTAAFPKAISGFEASLACVTDETDKRYADADEFRALLDKEPQAQQVYDLAVQLEDLVRSVGVHACGFVVASKPLMGRIPLVWDEKSQQIISGFPNAEALEPMGYLKVDCLGLDTMDVVELAVQLIEQRHGVDVDPELTRLDDPAAYEQLRSGHTVGLFQVASAGMAKLLQQMRADRFEDISAGLALYRPGPMGADAHTDYALRKTGRQQIRPIHPELEEPLRDILGPTYGVITYQEQIMRAAQAVAGYSLGEADLLRKAMGKKKPEVLAKEKPKLFAGMAEHGYSAEAAQALWDVFLPFSSYAFNISHTVSYGFITYATAWLKAHYPAEFMAALLTLAGDDKDKKALYLGECRRMGITVRVPDVNESGRDFTPTDDGAIRFGLSAVSGIGPAAVAGILAGREQGPYTSFNDFLVRVPQSACTKTAVGALVRAGAFDSLGYTRSSLTACYENGVGALTAVKKKQADGQFDLFSTVEEEVPFESVQVPAIDEWNKETLLKLERDALGLYVSGHPLDEFADVLAGNRTMSIAELQITDQTEGNVVLAGQLMSVERKIAKSGRPYAKLLLGDLDGQTEVMIFGQAFGMYQQLLYPDAKVAIKARLELREGEDRPSIYADTVTELDMSKTAASVMAAGRVDPETGRLMTVRRPAKGNLVVLYLRHSRVDRQFVAALKGLMLRYPGRASVVISWLDAPDDAEMFDATARSGLSVDPSAEFMSELKALVGHESSVW